MHPETNFQIVIWDTSNSPLCRQPGETPAWRWKVTVFRDGMRSRALYKEGCEDTLDEAARISQIVVNTYGVEN